MAKRGIWVALCCLLLSGCQPTTRLTEPEAYNALVDRCQQLIEKLYAEAPLLAKSGNARRLLSLRQNEGFAPVGVEPYRGGMRVSPDTAAFRAGFAKLEKTLASQFSKAQKQNMSAEGKAYNKIMTKLDPMMRGAEMWSESLRARPSATQGWTWSANAIKLDMDEGFLSTRRKVTIWVKKLEKKK